MTISQAELVSHQVDKHTPLYLCITTDGGLTLYDKNLSIMQIDGQLLGGALTGMVTLFRELFRANIQVMSSIRVDEINMKYVLLEGVNVYYLYKGAEDVDLIVDLLEELSKRDLIGKVARVHQSKGKISSTNLKKLDRIVKKLF